MTGCGFGPCGRTNVEEGGPGLVSGARFRAEWPQELRRDRWHCYLCYVLPLLFPPIVKCGRLVKGEPCVLVKDHPGWVPCRSDSKPEKEDTSTRDGENKLAAAKERRHPMWEKRRRVGPHRSNA